jgi:ElaB/YqjD/DUF883 family membrane-anchored ribosome-binding protein
MVLERPSGVLHFIIRRPCFRTGHRQADTRRTVHMAETIKRAAESAASEAERRYGETAEAARERIDRILGQARATGRHTVETLEETVEAHPFLSVLATFLAGILVGHLLSRR